MSKATSTSRQEPVAPAAEMKYPYLGVDGRLFDLGIPDRLKSVDPYFGPCPSWCADRHVVESSDEDRNHYTPMVAVPIRSITSDYQPGAKGEPDGYVLGHALMYMRRNVLHRDPVIWLGQGDSATGFSLTPGEAVDVATVLLSLADQAGVSSETGGPDWTTCRPATATLAEKVAERIRQQRALTVDEVKRIADVLGCNASDLVGEVTS